MKECFFGSTDLSLEQPSLTKGQKYLLSFVSAAKDIKDLPFFGGNVAGSAVGAVVLASTALFPPETEEQRTTLLNAATTIIPFGFIAGNNLRVVRQNAFAKFDSLFKKKGRDTDKL